MDEIIDGHPRFADAQRHFHGMHASSIGGLGVIDDLAAASDGGLFAVTGSMHATLGGRPTQRVGIIDVTTRSLQLLGSGHCERQPQFSPDASQLAFLTDREAGGIFQLQLIEVGARARIRSAPRVAGTIESYAWSADGQRILIRTAGLGADRASAQGSGPLVEARDDSSWRPRLDRRGAVEAEAWRSLWIWQLGQPVARRITGPGISVWEADWCGPDEIIALCSDHPHEGAWYDADLRRLRTDGTCAGRLANLRGDQLGTPCASPTGGSVACIAGLASDRMVVAGDVAVFAPAQAEPRLAELGGLQVTHIAWRSETLLFCIGFLGFETVALEYDTRDGSRHELWRSHETCGGGALAYPKAALTPGGGFATLMQSYKRPPTPALIEGGRVQLLYEPHDAGLDEVAASNGRIEEVRWTGRDGLEIEGYLVTPEGAAPHPLVVLVHGGPVFAFRNSWAMAYIFTPLLVRHGYAVLHPNPRGSAGRSRDFAAKVRGDIGGEDAFDIIRGVEALIERGAVDPARVATMGRSYGGYLSAWMTSQCSLFAASIAMNCGLDWYSRYYTTNAPEFQQLFLGDGARDVDGLYFERSVLMRASQIETPTLFVVGERDFGSPPAQGLMVHRALIEAGTASAYVAYPEEGHHISRLEAQIDLCARCLI